MGTNFDKIQRTLSVRVFLLDPLSNQSLAGLTLPQSVCAALTPVYAFVY